MPSDKVKRELTLEINTDLSKIDKEVSKLEKSLTASKWAEKEAKAAGDEHRLSMIRQQKALSELRRQQKAARSALKNHTVEQEKATGIWGQLTNSLNLQTLALGALGGAIYGTIGLFKSAIDAGKNWEGTVGGLESETEKLSEATDSLISELSLARLVEYKNELKLTKEQTEAVAKAAIHYGRIAKIDFNQALKAVTDMAVNARVRGLSKLGIVIDDVAGTPTEKMKKALDALTEKFGNLEVAASNADEQSIKFANTQESLEGRMGSALVKSAAYEKTVEALAKTKAFLIQQTTKTIYYITELQDEAVNVVRNGLGPFGDAIMTVAEHLGIAENRLADLVSGMKGLEDVVVHSATASMEDLERQMEAIVQGGPRVANSVIAARKKIFDAERKLAEARKRAEARDKKEKDREEEKERREKSRREQRALRYQERAHQNYERKLTTLKRDHARQREQIAASLDDSEQRRREREAEIEALKGRLNYLAESARLSNIYIDLRPYILSQPVDTRWRPAETAREAVARGQVRMARSTLEMLVAQAAGGASELSKGDVLGVAQVAGIGAAKKTWDLIPLCHPLPLNSVELDLQLDQGKIVAYRAKVRISFKYEGKCQSQILRGESASGERTVAREQAAGRVSMRRQHRPCGPGPPAHAGARRHPDALRSRGKLPPVTHVPISSAT